MAHHLKRIGVGLFIAVLLALNIAPALTQSFPGLLTTDRLLGRDSAGTGQMEQLTVGGALSFTGSGGITATGANILTQLLTVDGAGSGLDADLLDGVSSAGFLQDFNWTDDAATAGLSITEAETMTFAGDTAGIDTSGSANTLTISFDVTEAETNIEAAIDTLANLVSIQSLTVTLADAGTNAFLGWDDTAGAYENLTNAEAIAALAIDLGTDTTGNYVATVADGTGVDGTASGEGTTYTPTLDLTEITEGTGIDLLATTISLDLTELNTAVFGSGTFTTLDFNAGVTDPRFTFGSDSLTITNAATIGMASSTVTTGNIELNHASANTLTASGGTLSIEGVALIPDATNSVDAANINFDYVGTVADGTGIDGTATGEGSTFTPTLDLTEVNSTTWGSGTFTTMTFNAGVTDPVFTFGTNSLAISSAIVSVDQELNPDADGGADLGTTLLAWDDLFLDTGAVINFDAGDVTITHSANDLAFAGVTGDYSFDDSVFVTGVVDASTDVDAAGDVIVGDDILITDDINFGSSDVLITYGVNDLDFSGVTGDYSFDDDVLVTGIVDASGNVDAGGDLIAGDDALLTDDIDFGAGDVQIAYSANDLGFTGVTGDYSFDDTVGVTGSVTASVDVTATAGDVTAGDDVIATDDLTGDDATLLDDLSVLSMTSNDAGAAGSVVQCRHDSASAVDGDIACDFQVYAGADDEEVGRIAYELDDGATTTEDGRFNFHVDVAGASAQQMVVGAGVIIGAGTTMPGAGDLTIGDDLFIEGDVIDFEAGDITLTRGANTLTIAGGTVTLDLADNQVAQADIGDDAVGEAELDFIDGDTHTDEDCVTYDTGAGGSFETQSCASVGGDNLGSDADRGDITVSGGSGAVADVDADVVISGATPTPTITGTDAGAVGPVLTLQHDSASAADGDIAADIQVKAGADDEEVGRIALEVDDGSTTSEDTRWRLFNDVAGASVESFTLTGALATFAGSVTAATDVTATAGDVTSGDDVIVGDDAIMSSASPQISFTDTDTNADSFITANSSAGALQISADNGNEVASSRIIMSVDGTNQWNVDGTMLYPEADATEDIGSASAGVRDIFVTSDVEFNGGTDTTLTAPAAGELTVEGKPVLTAIGVQSLTTGTAATYTPTSGSKFFKVTCTGGGGAGGGSDTDGSGAAAGGGGEAGGTTIAWYDATEMGADATYTIGTGGVGVAATGDIDGTDTTFNPAGTGATMTAAGGDGGSAVNGTTDANVGSGGVAEGTATGGDVNLGGGEGSSGVSGPADGVSNPPFAFGGIGGASYWGGGPRPVMIVTATQGAGGSADPYGAGGSGSANVDNTTNSAGGNGADGICVVEEFGS
jgi:hypothetical protein